MFDLTDLEIGAKVSYDYEDPDGAGRIVGVVTEIFEDHAIVEADGIKLWCDESIPGFNLVTEDQPTGIFKGTGARPLTAFTTGDWL